MPRFILNAWHVGTLMVMAGIGPPVQGSPLRSLRTYPRPIAPGEPDWDYLVEKRLVVDDGEGWRVNSVMAGVLRACADPEEVTHIGVGDEQNPGFSIARRGELNVECTVATVGTTKFSFPLTRSEVALSLISALSGDDSDAPKPSGFKFRGRAEDAFVLGAALRETRGDYVPMTVPGLKKAVAAYALEPKLTAGFSIIGEGDGMEGLATSSRKVDAAIKRLITVGHLKMVRDKVKVSTAAEAALTKWPTGIFAINHVEFDEQGPVSRVMQAMRVGGRTLVFRPIQRPGHDPEFDWSEVTRRELRILVAGMLLRDEELEAFLGGKKVSAAVAKKSAADAAKRAVKRPSQTGSAGAQPESTPRPRRPRAVAAATTAAPAPGPAPARAKWSPTHLVPNGGLPTWGAADPNSAQTARLDGGLEVSVDATQGAWSHVVCSNGWSAWLDGRALEEV